MDDGQDDYSEEDRDRADEAEEEGAARKRGRNSDAAKARKRRAILFGGQANKVTSMFLRPAAPLLAPAKPGKEGAAGAGGADAAAPTATPALDDFESLIGDLDKPSAPSRWGFASHSCYSLSLSLSPRFGSDGVALVAERCSNCSLPLTIPVPHSHMPNLGCDPGR